MTRVRQWLLTLAVAAVLVLSFGSAALAADPIDPGTGDRSWSESNEEDGDKSWGGSRRSTASDPTDPGTGP